MLLLVNRLCRDCLHYDFKKTSDISVVSVDSTTESYAERGLKKRKLEQANDSCYEVPFICPTSNIADRLFSQSGNNATKSSLWNLKTVESVL